MACRATDALPVGNGLECQPRKRPTGGLACSGGSVTSTIGPATTEPGWRSWVERCSATKSERTSASSSTKSSSGPVAMEMARLRAPAAAVRFSCRA